jgi:hypothetical protein
MGAEGSARGGARADDRLFQDQDQLIVKGASAAARRAARFDRWPAALAAVVLTIALVPTLFPFLHDGFFFGHDALAQVTYAYRLDRALHQGQFPVRWTEPVKAGLGQPLFNYYQVGFHYMVAAVHAVVPSVLTSLEATTVLLWWGGAALMFVLCRRMGTLPAAAAAGTFALSPYMIVDVFVRAALTEFAAITWAVAAMWMLDRFLQTGSRVRLAGLAVCCAAMALCHLPGSLILAPMFAAHAAWLLFSGRTRLANLGAAAAAGALALGLAAFYVGPAMLELDLVQIRRMAPEGVEYQRHFLPLAQFVRYTLKYDWSYGTTVTDPGDLMPQHVAAIEWLLMASAAVIAIAAAVRRRFAFTHGGLIAWLGVALFALFMMSRASLGVWQQIPALALLQFPWRYFMLIPIAAGMLAALLVTLLPSRGWQAVAMLLIVGSQVHFYHRDLNPRDYGILAEWGVDDPGWRQSAVARHIEYIDFAFTPSAVTVDPAPAAGRWSIVGGAATVAEQLNLDHRRSYVIDSFGGGTFVLHTPYFPGWMLTLDGRNQLAGPRPGDAFMEIQVPPGRHTITASFEDTAVRRWSNRVSLASLALTLALLLWPPKRLL